jgi:hypothetical protein
VTQGTAPPGWYPDPVEPGRHRWWDGAQWGQQAPVAPAPVAPTPVVEPAGHRESILPTDYSPSSTQPQPTPSFGAWRRATGKLRTAGHLVLGGGIGIAVSAFLPWVTVFGVFSVSLSGDEVLIVLIFGGASAFLGVRLLQDRANIATMIALWVLSAFDLLVSIGFFVSLSRDRTDVVGHPAIGFYAALLGLLATIAGTAVMQIGSRR